MHIRPAHAKYVKPNPETNQHKREKNSNYTNQTGANYQ